MSRNPASLTAEQRKAIRRSMVPAGAIRVAHKAGLYEIYLYTNRQGRSAAVAFRGKAIKPAFRYQFLREADRIHRCKTFADAQESAAAERAQRRANRKSGHSLQVGAVLRSVWGYDQTNVDYYEVTALRGTTMVEVREIAAQTESTGMMQGRCMPIPGQYIGEPKRRRVNGDMVRISDCQRAHLMQPMAHAGGRPIYEASHWSNDH